MSVLEKICADKRVHVEAQKQVMPLDKIKFLSQENMTTPCFINRLKEVLKDGIALITEVKKASPSKGIIREDFNPVEIAQTYKDHGAACLSVLTDEPYFQGCGKYFTDIRAKNDLPMLRKDFMIDPYQIYESRVMGADCILLIMACLSDTLAEELYGIATTLGMDVLFEVHDETELHRALSLKPQMLGVNNRNLKTLGVNLQTGLDLAKHIPDDILTVAESGIYAPQHIKDFQDAGYSAFLIGESLMREDDIGQAVKNLTQNKN